MTLGIFGGNMFKSTLEEETNRNTDQMIDQVWNNIEMLIQMNDNIMYYLSKEEAVKQFMKKNPSKKLKTAVNEEMEIYTDRHPEVAGILLVNKYGDFTSREIDRISRDPLTKESWYKKAVQSPETIQLISNSIGRNIKNTSNYQRNNVLTLVKAVVNPTTKEVQGVLLIDLKLDSIKEVIESVKIGKSGFIFIMDEDGNVVYSPVNPIVYRIHPDWLAAKESPPIEKEIEGSRYQFIYNTIPDIGWKIVGVFSIDETTEVVSDVMWFTFGIAVITLIIGSIVSVFFASTITKPVNKLKTLMRNVEDGRFDMRFNSKYNDEIGQLGNNYNRMIQEIERLIQLVYMEQKRKREAELKILQAQINPHFLYNTLDTIQWMAYEYKANKIVELVNALTTLFRIGLNKGNEIISVEDEVEHVESYLIIQMTRYESKLEYEINADKTVKEYKVLKLILQPLVENAIYHGIRNKRGKGKITILVTQKADMLILEVNDTGIGIQKDVLDRLNDTLKNKTDEQKKGFGLYNVSERIKLTYGSEYGLEVFSEYNEGTTVIAKLPIKKK
ncbi:histidine kinase [Virgibacillus phasianinus]|uniref:histidine kinase n=2 Tax=Virgibacillus phasianinus TaxID=2017483 RepID=A0A220U2B3_9BACI|nr:histidine kinase [Virgibacillus phasianinus]